MSEEQKPTCSWCGRYMDRHLGAYYYGFEETGVEAVDHILCSVASAGKGYHHTENWCEPHGDGEESYVDLIQKAAVAAATALAAAQRDQKELAFLLAPLESRTGKTGLYALGAHLVEYGSLVERMKRMEHDLHSACVQRDNAWNERIAAQRERDQLRASYEICMNERDVFKNEAAEALAVLGECRDALSAPYAGGFDGDVVLTVNAAVLVPLLNRIDALATTGTR